MNHLLIAVTLPFTAGLIYYLSRKCRASLPALIILPVIMIISMLWAIAPDLPRLFGNMELYHQLSFDPRCNIFYWHYTLDITEKDSFLYPAGFILLAFSMLLAVWREIKLTEKN